MKVKPKVGSKMKTWFSGRPDGLSRVISVRKYKGAFPNAFHWTVRLTAEGTREGWLEMCI